eukprot:TRINITY_DN10674_c0_g1_i1.p1 TRINITY_DN10674_c0_g1~~TRINITY_DN10674_c0_g1_i1.p1  ORF type:complete len:238 (+),score=100.15 TRINITY_DN10674_c0_g1_i1:56-715(+)
MAEVLAFKDWLSTSLKELQLDDEAYTDYIQGIMDDSSVETSEKTESVIGFLSAATEVDLTQFGSKLSEWSDKITKEKQTIAEEKKNKGKQELEKQQKEAEQGTTVPKEEVRPTQTKLSKEEKKKRDKLLARFAYVEERVDENGDILISDDADDEETQTTGNLEKNVNSQKVKDQEQALRDKSKAAHLKKVAKDKEDREKEALKKEKAKRQTQKREKRRM